MASSRKVRLAWTSPRLLGRLDLFDLVQMRFDKAHEIVADLFVRWERSVLVVDIAMAHRAVEDFLHRRIVLRQQIHPIAPVLHVLVQRIVRVAACADVLVHVVPVKVFQLLGGKVDAAHLVRIVLRSMEPVPIVDVDRWIWMALGSK